MATQSVVEMQKIINRTPFDTIWVYWETDLYYVENSSTFDTTFGDTFYLSEDASDIIVVRTHDKLLSGNSASLYIGGTPSIIPVGTYSVEDYNLIVATAGIIDYVEKVGTNSTTTLLRWHEQDVPTSDEQYMEWTIVDEKKLMPYWREDGILSIGATYSQLVLRT